MLGGIIITRPKLLGRLCFMAMLFFFAFHIYRVVKLNKEVAWLSGNLSDTSMALEICKESLKKDGSVEDTAGLFDAKMSEDTKESVLKTKRVNGGRSFQKLVHLDLKGAPPTSDYLVKIMPFLKKLGVDAIMIEYEDMFPYQGILKDIASKHAYQAKEIKLLLKTASHVGLDVVPLMQSFGHLEFVLKHKQFSHLKEVPKYSDMLCPSLDKSQKLIFEMIDQVLALHPGIKRLHIGGDEVFNLQMCKTCFLSRKSKVDLYLQHMIPVIKHVHSRSNGSIRSIIWDDMLRKFNNKQLKTIAKLSEIMVWSYVPDVARYAAFPDNMWKRYALTFDKIWIASSYKGGYLPNQNLPPIKMHIENNISWLKLISSLPENVEILGVALTGWSRFDHFATMCELFPVAIPSLAICLQVLKAGLFDKYILAQVGDHLGLDSGIQFKKEYFSNYIVESGNFPGSSVYAIALELENHVSWYDNINTRMDGWGNKRQEENNVSSIAQIEGVGESLKKLVQSLDTFSEKARKTLNYVYFKKDVEEWMEDKVYSLNEKTKQLVIRTNNIFKRSNYFNKKK